jgi:hypothetical protein
VLDRTAGAALKLGGYSLEPVAVFDARSDALWAAASAFYPVICRRDQATLNWRFIRFPHPRYAAYYVRHHDRTIAHVVLRIGEWNGLPAGFIVDYLCAPRWVVPTLALSVQALRAHAIAAIYCLHSSPFAARALALLGFAKRSSSFPLMFRAAEWSDEERAIASDVHAWFITGADADADRPREGTVFADASARGGARPEGERVGR